MGRNQIQKAAKIINWTKESGKGDGWHKGVCGRHFFWWTNGWVGSPVKGKRERGWESRSSVSLRASLETMTAFGPSRSTCSAQHVHADEAAVESYHHTQVSANSLCPPTGGQIPLLEQQQCIFFLNPLLGQGCFSFPYCNQGCENCEALLETRTQTCTHAYSLVLSQTHGRTKNQLGLS